MTGSSKYDPEKQKLKVQAYVKRHPNRRLHSVAKARAKRRNIEFSLGYDDIVIPEVCPVFGFPISVGAGSSEAGKTYEYNWATLDRIDPTKGYLPGNVRVISFLANRMKASATQEQLVMFAEWVLQNNNNKDTTND